MMRRGLGEDVTALAQAFLAGQINPSYGPARSSPSAFAGVQPTPWPSSDFPDLGTAQQIAGLLGASVQSLPVEDAGGVLDIPTTYWASLPGGNVRISDIIQAGNLASGNLCSVADNLANAIPGGEAPSQCNFTPVNQTTALDIPTVANPLPAGAPASGSTLAPGAVIGTVAPPTPPPPALLQSGGNLGQCPSGYVFLNGQCAPGTVVGSNITVPSNPAVGNPVPATSTISTSTPGASIGTTTAPAATSSDIVLGGFDLTQAASGLPWWGWAIGAGALLLLFTGGKR